VSQACIMQAAHLDIPSSPIQAIFAICPTHVRQANKAGLSSHLHWLVIR